MNLSSSDHLEKFQTAPRLKLLEIGLLMNLDSTTPSYACVDRKKILPYSRELRRLGYEVNLFFDIVRSERDGRYVLEVKHANRS